MSKASPSRASTRCSACGARSRLCPSRHSSKPVYQIGTKRASRYRETRSSLRTRSRSVAAACSASKRGRTGDGSVDAVADRLACSSAGRRRQRRPEPAPRLLYIEDDPEPGACAECARAARLRRARGLRRHGHMRTSLEHPHATRAMDGSGAPDASAAGSGEPPRRGPHVRKVPFAPRLVVRVEQLLQLLQVRGLEPFLLLAQQVDLDRRPVIAHGLLQHIFGRVPSLPDLLNLRSEIVGVCHGSTLADAVYPVRLRSTARASSRSLVSRSFSRWR